VAVSASEADSARQDGSTAAAALGARERSEMADYYGKWDSCTEYSNIYPR